MVLRSPLRLASFVAGAAVVALALACNDATTETTAGDDGGAGGADGGPSKGVDAGAPSDGSAWDAGDGAPPRAIEDGPSEAGAECAFNRDCQAALRCECSEASGCACAPGARGTGRNGLDACDSGDQCASSLCVEGPDPGESICSDACKTNADCTGKLPRCITISGIPEPICVRTP
jgi:hypothetical protein